MTTQIRIFGRERQTTVKDTGEVKKYVVFSYTKNGEEFYEVKFKQSCTTTPKLPGYWLLTLEKEKVNIQKRKAKEGYKPNNILWIEEVIKAEKDVKYEEELKVKRLAEVAEIL